MDKIFIEAFLLCAFSYVKLSAMKSVEAIILAGGYGQRMREHTANQQKCLLKIDGQPAIQHVMNALIDAFGSINLIIVTGFQKEQVEKYVNAHKQPNMNVQYVYHTPGSPTWSLYADMRDRIRGVFLGAPGDVIALPEVYQKTLELFEKEQVDAAVALSPNLNEAPTHGVGKMQQTKLVELQTPPPKTFDPDHLRSMTIWASKATIFERFRIYEEAAGRSLTGVLQKALRDRGNLAGYKYMDPWIHLGTVEDLNKKLRAA